MIHHFSYSIALRPSLILSINVFRTSFSITQIRFLGIFKHIFSLKFEIETAMIPLWIGWFLKKRLYNLMSNRPPFYLSRSTGPISHQRFKAAKKTLEPKETFFEYLDRSSVKWLSKPASLKRAPGSLLDANFQFRLYSIIKLCLSDI